MQIALQKILRYYPKGIFQRATSQMSNFPRGNFPKVRLGLLRRRRLQWWPNARLGWAKGPSAKVRTSQGPSAKVRTSKGPSAKELEQARGRTLRHGLTWEVATCQKKNTLWKLPLGKFLLESTQYLSKRCNNLINN